MINPNYGFSSVYSEYDQRRIASATDFAMANFAYKDTSYQDIYGIGTSYYWTSSAVASSFFAYLVDFSGVIDRCRVADLSTVARPALLFNL